MVVGQGVTAVRGSNATGRKASLSITVTTVLFLLVGVTPAVAEHVAEPDWFTEADPIAVTSSVGRVRDFERIDDVIYVGGSHSTLRDYVAGPDIGPADLGRARRVEADRQHLVVAGGHGLAEARRAEIQRLEHRLRQTPAGDPERDELQARLGRLAGSAAILKLGAATRAEREVLRQKAEQGLRALEATLHGGYADGGGRAFTLCRAGLEALTYASEDEKLGGEAVARALTAPFFRLLINAGVAAPAVILDELERRPAGTVYNVLTRRFEPAQDAGIVDPVPVLTMSLETAASGAVMALSVAAMVLKRRPRLSYEP